MSSRSLSLAAAAVAITVGFVASDALAAAQRTFVRSDGIDSNACSILQPCRSFGAALLKTSVGGEIIVLDSAGYGPVVINQSVSIVAPSGIYAGVSVSAGDGIAINGDAAAKVVLRGLTVNGLGGNEGIHLLQGARLHIEACEISNMTGNGISVESAGAEVFINDSIVRDNGASGIIVTAIANVVIDRLHSERNNNGIFAENGNVTVRDSVVSRNTFYGIAIDTVGSASTLAVENSMIVGNFADGIRAISQAAGTLDVVVTRNVIVDNDWGVAVAGFSVGKVYAAVTDNIIKGSRNVGLLVVDSATATASGNTISRSGAAGIQSSFGIIRTRANNTVMDNSPDLDPLTTLTPLGPL